MSAHGFSHSGDVRPDLRLHRQAVGLLHQRQRRWRVTLLCQTNHCVELGELQRGQAPDVIQ